MELLPRDIADEESWIKEKTLLVNSNDYGRDLIAANNLIRKHKRIENELSNHEAAIGSVQTTGNVLISTAEHGTDDIKDQLMQLTKAWEELKYLAKTRFKKLEESMTYQKFLVNLDEEETWLAEKQQLLSRQDLGDNMAIVQGRKLIAQSKTSVNLLTILDRPTGRPARLPKLNSTGENLFIERLNPTPESAEEARHLRV